LKVDGELSANDDIGVAIGVGIEEEIGGGNIE